jgi:hypothetical protein
MDRDSDLVGKELAVKATDRKVTCTERYTTWVKLIGVGKVQIGPHHLS